MIMGMWKEYRLGEITSIIGDGLHGTPQYDGNGNYLFINGNNLRQGRIVIKPDTNMVNEQEYLKYKKPLSNKTILLSINGTIGNLALYRNEKCVLGKSVCYINATDIIDRLFLYYVFTNGDFLNYLIEIATGTTISNVPLKGDNGDLGDNGHGRQECHCRSKNISGDTGDPADTGNMVARVPIVPPTNYCETGNLSDLSHCNLPLKN